jgi:hypothetical protein
MFIVHFHIISSPGAAAVITTGNRDANFVPVACWKKIAKIFSALGVL